MFARFLYSLVLVLLIPIAWVYLYCLRGRKNPGYRQHFGERFGYAQATGDIILHCASVGEVLASAPLIKALLGAKYRLIITCNTPTGREQITTLFADAINKERLSCCYLPFDLPWCQRRFIRRTQAKVLSIIETELWPNLLKQAKQAGLATVIINARLSAKSANRYAKVAPLTRDIMRHIDVLACHHHDDAERFVKLGLAQHKVHVTGSIKFDITVSEKHQQQAQQLRHKFNKPFVWIAGSTHPCEPELLLQAHQQLLKQQPSALLIIAPRHPEQFDNVATVLKQQNYDFCRRSHNDYQGQSVMLADTLGELTMLYGCADLAFIGGSLIARGGHNPLEACAHAIPVLTGPHTFNFAHVYPELINQGGAQQVQADNLAAQLIALSHDPHKRQQMGAIGLNVVKKNQGAIAKTLAIIEEYTDV
ncbi:lipid IV(A) 3-deoxy-D-manno-octulosonic acid transferase [Pseudoalteromonas ruthenica]|uniref:lipid IV(A) 3-deoxy-D-manno-octulosonic acid transferase n=1 Tax=Pseudoalteromonas ruthenica TaxID=151081 RepID=UPI00241EE0DA|nr:lipid IV(A) 3-deoxy-D-manno-octulosonic acid transferase [Pseudoalteromonas ruthenica]